MLTSLLIRNFALIEDLRITFSGGMTVITGETGAGKSIVIDALSLALGERADTGMIRDGAPKTLVEAEFELPDDSAIRPRVEALGIDWQPVLILRREVSIKGASRGFVNDTPVAIADLKGIGDRLVDIHGQHEHQSLLHTDTHIGILDAFGASPDLVETHTRLYTELVSAVSRLTEKSALRDTVNERRAVLDYQLKELAALDPREGEDAEIEQELRIVENAERIVTRGEEALGLLFDGETNATDLLGRARKILADLGAVDPALASLGEELEIAAANAQDASRSLRTHLERIDFDPDRPERLRHRLAELNAAKRKYRATLTELLGKKRAMEEEYAGLDTVEGDIEALRERVSAARAAASVSAIALSDARVKAGRRLAREVIRELRELGIPDARFEVRARRIPVSGAGDEDYLDTPEGAVAASERGIDEIEFFISTNAGEDVKQLAKVVSGGEVSRVMLALKSIFAGRDAVPVMVFDEIDVGVSGRIAQKVGLAMKRLAAHHQIIAITHLPQIAGAGDAHLSVSKQVADGRTRTVVDSLSLDERAREVARLMSGDTITEASIQSALELLGAR